MNQRDCYAACNRIQYEMRNSREGERERERVFNAHGRGTVSG